jgi:hypothetical protein
MRVGCCLTMTNLAAYLIGLLFASVLAVCPPAASAWQAPVEIGILTCSLAPSAPPITNTDQVGEGRDIECRFRAGWSAAEETYVGFLQFVGKANQAFANGTIMLVAKGSATVKAVPGSLEQQYAAGGRIDGGTTGQGPLVGERDSSVVLHPLAQRFDQPSLALGQPAVGLIIVMELRLKSAPA